jgi:hypothetical protein
MNGENRRQFSQSSTVSIVVRMSSSAHALSLSSVLTRLALLEEQVQRHEDELATCLSQGLAAHQPGGDVSGLERVVKSEQLYRQSQELLYGERHVLQDISRGLSLLRESASLGHSDSVFAWASIWKTAMFTPGIRKRRRVISGLLRIGETRLANSNTAAAC